MAFTLANWNCIANGPYANVFTYHTADTISSTAINTSSILSSYFTSTDPDKIGVGDIILVSHTNGASASELITLLVTAAATTGVTCVVNR